MPFLRKRQSESGFALVELLVAIVVIAIIAVATALAITKSLALQQDGESYDKAIQVARGYIETAKQSSFANLGFHTVAIGYRPQSADGLEDTVVIPIDKTDFPLDPTTQSVVGGISYQVRTDITWTQTTHAVSPKRVLITVLWSAENGITKTTTISFVRAANASEQIPSGLDITVIATANGTPSAPSYFDTISSYGGYTSMFGTGFMFRILNQGDYPLTNIQFSIVCPSQAPSIIYWDTSISALYKKLDGTTYQFFYYDVPPAQIGCPITTATTTIRAANNIGYGPPLIVGPSNFKTN